MRHGSAIVVLAGLAAMLGACGDDDNAPGPSGVSKGEARALDEAAAMIESQPSIPVDGPVNGPVGSQAGEAGREPAANAPGDHTPDR